MAFHYKIITNSEKEFDVFAFHPLQSKAWGEARKALGKDVIRIGKYSENDDLIGVVNIIVHKLFFGKKLGYIPRGRDISWELIQFLQTLGKNEGIVYFLLEPDDIDEVELKKMLKSKILKEATKSLFPKWTLSLDISKNEEDLLKNMHPKTRYNIRLAQKKGVIVKEMKSSEGFEIFQKLYFATTKRQKYFGHNYTYHKTVWENMSNAGLATILVAFFQDEPLAAYELFFNKDTLFYPYGGTSDKYREMMASTLLMWEAVKYGKKLHLKKFDLWGAADPKAKIDDTWRGFTRFKMGFGASYEEKAGSFDLVVDRKYYEVMKWIFSLRNFYMKIMRSFV